MYSIQYECLEKHNYALEKFGPSNPQRRGAFPLFHRYNRESASLLFFLDIPVLKYS